MGLVRRLVPEEPVTSLDDYLGRGGCSALVKALSLPPEETIEVLKASGLRGRGGAGFGIGAKWHGGLTAEGTRYFVCNAAEGEPATFKDRYLIRKDPYRLVEGVAIGAHVIGAVEAYIAIKRSFETEVAALTRAIEEMTQRDLLGGISIRIALGPDEYLFGEEKAMMEVIEGKEPMPRMMPPYMHGLWGEPYRPNPTTVNNVETLMNVPGILEWGPEWFRSVGTEGSPGTMVQTLVGDVRRPGVYEIELGTTLGEFLFEIGGGPRDGHTIKAVVPGSSHGVLTPDSFETPLDFDALGTVGSGLGTGFTVYDDTACMVAVARLFSRFLYVESCGQCNPCKLHSGRITSLLEEIEEGVGTDSTVQAVVDSCVKVTDGNRCYLAQAEQVVVRSIVLAFIEEFAAHLDHGCPSARRLVLPKIHDYDEQTQAFVFDERHMLKRPDWTYPQRSA